MLSIRLLQIIRDKSQEIADRVVRKLAADRRLDGNRTLPEPTVRERTLEITADLPNWVASPETEIAQRYEELGVQRYREGVPLSEMVRTYQVIRESIVQYVRDQGLELNTLYLYAEGELDRATDSMFDAMIYYLVRGYERAGARVSRAS